MLVDAHDAAADIPGRNFSISPARMGSDAQFVIAETLCVAGPNALSDEWTVSSVQAAFEQTLGMLGAEFTPHAAFAAEPSR